MCWRSSGSGEGQDDTRDGGSNLKQGHPEMEEQVLLLLLVFEVCFISMLLKLNNMSIHLGDCERPVGPPAGSTGTFVPSVNKQVSVQIDAEVRYDSKPPLNSTKPYVQQWECTTV